MVHGESTQNTVQEGSALPTLLPLTPRYDEASHKAYVDAVEGALEGASADDIRNIALTGGYGVGKSSVLQEVAAKHKDKVVQVSLSTLGFERDSSSTSSESKTNLIQKEIVKQLLYREEPAMMPGSRFKRIGRFQKSVALAVSALVGTVLLVVFVLAGWTTQLAAVVTPIDLGLWNYLVLWGVFACTAFATLALLHNRLRIRQVKVADADISLAEDASSYFDQYLDEIVYFFDVTKRDIVIFEDIDRFDDARIFETLRALNTLLNGAGQLKGRRIRFIYAIKDSIFVKIGKLLAGGIEDEPNDDEASTDLVAAEVERANRTKFFDLVIPVVPFITHRNARNLMDTVLEGINGEISSELIDLASRHITDMRLIKNVRNEFVIFKDKVFQTDDGDELALSDDGLFAMMLYKSTHLADFEKIKTRTSKLDGLYDAHAGIVSKEIAALNREAREKRAQLTHLTTVDTRSRELGDALTSYAERIGRHTGVAAPVTLSVALAGQDRSEDIHSPEFWRSFADSTGQIEIGFLRNGTQRGQFSITKDDAITVFGDDLASASQWDEANRAFLRDRLAEIASQRDELSHSDMIFLIDHDEYTDENGKNFRQLTDVLESELARQLVTAGYIGRDFTLYTSSYYSGRVSTRAQNFLMRNVDRNIMNVDYLLDPTDVTAIVQDRSDTVLREHGMYNISVLDHLLAPQWDGEDNADFGERQRLAKILVRSLMANGDDEKSFFDAYFNAGGHQDALVRMLAERWTRVFDLVINRSELDDDERVKLFNSALESIGDDVEYQIKADEVRPFVEQHFASMPVLTSESTVAEVADRVAKGFARAEVRLASLKPLGSEVRRATVAVNGYEISRENLELALGSGDLALDQIRAANESVYKYVLTDLGSYLEALRKVGTSPMTVSSPGALAPIVADVVGADLNRLPAVLDGAAKDATVETLAKVPASAWPALADHRAFPLTLSNVTAYIATVGTIDEHLGGQLSEAKQIDVPEDADQPTLVALAEQLLRAKGTIPDPAVRVDLVASLSLDDWLSLSAVPAEKGSLIGLLIEREVVKDDADTIALAFGQDWSTREFAISKSKNYAGYVTTAELPSMNVAPLMASTLVSDSVKEVVLERADEFVPTDDKTPLAGLANYAVRKNALVPIPLVTRMATAGVDASIIVQLLAPLLPQLDEPALVTILTALGGDYLTASRRNGKRPKLPNTTADLALIERLEALGIASSHTQKDQVIKVNMKKS